MYSEVQTLSWDWIKAVLVSALAVLSISGGILIPLSKLTDEERLNRLPHWLRWLLVLPIAIVMGLVAEVVPRFVFAIGEAIVNHHLLFKPGVDSLIWQLWAPLWFVASGVSMAPGYKFSTFIVVGGLKAIGAGTNLVTNLTFVGRAGSWEDLDPIMSSPIWWNSIVHLLCLGALVTFGWVLARQSWNAASKRDRGYESYSR
jgi:hypothetical protein